MIPIVDVATGHDFTCAKIILLNHDGKESGKIKCWGSNHLRQLGLSTQKNYGDAFGSKAERLQYAPFMNDIDVHSFATGAHHVCVIASIDVEKESTNDDKYKVLQDKDEVYCWGANYAGQLGLGTNKQMSIKRSATISDIPPVNLGLKSKVKSITTGRAFTCVIADDSSVKCWGSNWYGQLGIGDYHNRGDYPYQMGVNLTHTRIASNDLEKVEQLALGSYHACAILNNQRIKCWGDNTRGQLGYGDTNNRGDEKNEMGEMLKFVDLGKDISVIQISLGHRHSCALTRSYLVKCWGFNMFGQLGLEHSINIGDDEHEMGMDLPFVNLGNELKVRQITSTFAGNCALMYGATGYQGMKCWGSNLQGELGLGLSERMIGNKKQSMGMHLPYLELVNIKGAKEKVTKISGGGSHVCMVLSSKRIKCFGDNSEGKLGYGDKISRGKHLEDVGKNLESFTFNNIPTPRAPNNNTITDAVTNTTANTISQNIPIS